MKHLLPLMALLMVTPTVFAQTQQEKIDSVCKLVQQYFNAKDAEKIYALTGEDFHKGILLKNSWQMLL